MDYRVKPSGPDAIAVPQSVFARLGGADEISIRAALYMIATGVTDPSQMARDLKLRSRLTAENAVSFWAGAGLLQPLSEAPKAAEKKKKLSWEEITEASRADPMLSGIITCAQDTLGKTLSRSEMEKLASLYLLDGFSPEVIMLCISYCTTINKRTIGAVSHNLQTWRADGVETAEQADRYLELLALRASRYRFAAELLGINAEDLTLGAKKAIDRWYEEYGFSDDILRECELQAGSKKDIWYWNGILRSWNSKGVRTVHDIRGGGTANAPGSRNVLVEREAPAETPAETAPQNDFLSANRRRRLKRKDG